MDTGGTRTRMADYLRDHHDKVIGRWSELVTAGVRGRTSLDEVRREVGELYSNTPYTFDGYWKLPEKTQEAFRGDYCTVGDMARREADGYYYLVDRKSNMIISGGENIYPSEVENLLGSHGKVKEVAVIGLPDAKWGERVHAVIILHDGQSTTEAEVIDWCRDKIAGYKRPRSVSFIEDHEMPRTATGKIQHRILKTKMGAAQ